MAGHRVEGGRLDAKAELGDEAGSPQEAQRILVEALVGIADGAQDPHREVGLSAEWIDELAGKGVGRHRVDGEVAPREVIDERDVVGDRRLAAGVGVFLAAIGGDLDREAGVARDIARYMEADGAEAFADEEDRGGASGEPERLRAVGEGIGAEVEIGGRVATDQEIADRTSDDVELRAGGGEGRAEALHDPPLLWRQRGEAGRGWCGGIDGHDVARLAASGAGIARRPHDLAGV